MFASRRAFGILIACAVLGGLFPRPSSGEPGRPKAGGPALSIYKKVPEGSIELSDGDKAAKGDILQLRYGPSAARYAIIASIDGGGTITWHYPSYYSGGSASSPRIREEGAFLESAFELDDAPSFERFFIISSKGSFDVATAAKALDRLVAGGSAATGEMRLPSGLQWSSFTVAKTSPGG